MLMGRFSVEVYLDDAFRGGCPRGAHPSAARTRCCGGTTTPVPRDIPAEADSSGRDPRVLCATPCAGWRTRTHRVFGMLDDSRIPWTGQLHYARRQVQRIRYPPYASPSPDEEGDAQTVEPSGLNATQRWAAPDGRPSTRDIPAGVHWRGPVSPVASSRGSCGCHATDGIRSYRSHGSGGYSESGVDEAKLPKPGRPELPHVDRGSSRIEPSDQRKTSMAHQPLRKGTPVRTALAIGSSSDTRREYR